MLINWNKKKTQPLQTMYNRILLLKFCFVNYDDDDGDDGDDDDNATTQ